MNEIVTPSKLTESIADGMERIWHLDRVVVDTRTKYQHVLIAQTAQGLTLFCDQERQSNELTQQIYHEGQVYPAMLMAKEINSALVIGSSEGVVCQNLAAAGAKKVVHVDIDLECVKLCAEHLPYGYTPAQLEDALAKRGPIELVIVDGFSYAKECAQKGEHFDIIVMDLPDEHPSTSAQQNRLYQPDFLKTLSYLLTEHGAFITQAGNSAYWRNESLKLAWKRMNSVFTTPVYFELDEQDWSWVVGVNYECQNPATIMRERLKSLSPKPRYIDDLSIIRSTILPISIRKDV